MLKNNIFTAKFNKNWLLKKSINLNFGLSISTTYYIFRSSELNPFQYSAEGQAPWE